MDELEGKLQSAKSKLNKSDTIHWIPIRHHSPACTVYLLELLEEYNPEKVLIEGSVDFNLQLDALSQSDTKAPVALYGEGSFFPLCDTSPEWVALRWAAKNKKQAFFIDLPMKDKAWKKEKLESGQISFIHEARLQHSEFINNLVSHVGCRDSDELWERWFELKQFSSARCFFDQVFDYCAAARLTYSKESISDSEDAAREAFMAEQIRLHTQGDECVFVITGGFHTLALLDYDNRGAGVESTNTRDSVKLDQSWLIRYSLDRLDANDGYSAGMRAPAFYERLFNHRLSHDADGFSREFVLETLALLEESSLFSFPINTAAKIEIAEQVLNLSLLRGHNWPGLFDTIDAINSVLIKHETTVSDPLQVKAKMVLSGNRLGSVSSEQPPLPLVNDLFQKLEKARFKLETTTKVSTKISLYRDKNRARMSLLYQCQFLQIDFATKVSGPDWARGNNLELRHEEWQYAWSPWVEARLVDLSIDGADWNSLLSHRINERKSELENSPLTDYQQFFMQLVLMGSLDIASDIWEMLNSAIDVTTDCDQLTELLFLLIRLRHVESDLFDNHVERLEILVAHAWQQLMFSLPTISKSELSDGLKVLLLVQELTQEFDEYFKDTWKSLWIDRLQWLVAHGELSAGLLYACQSLLVDLEYLHASDVLKSIERLFDYDEESAYSALFSVIKISPHWLRIKEGASLITMLNLQLRNWGDERFFESLPELRFLFSQLDPKMIESISSDVCRLNSWDMGLEVFDAEISEAQIIKAQKLQGEIVEHLLQRGLGHWINS